jgi:hypothetical protein
VLKTASAIHIETDAEYSAFEKLIADRVAASQGPLFTTNAEGLFEAYLAGIPEPFRQHYTCHCCRRFITNYGGLAVIVDGEKSAGKVESFLWDLPSVPTFFYPACRSMALLVRRAKVTGVFINGEKTWGNPRTGAWTHLSGTPAHVFCNALKTAFQEEAEKKQDYITLKRGLEEFPLEAVVQAVRVLEADAVDRSEKTLGVAQWLLALHRSIADLRGSTRDNIIWLAVAKAPAGWCHIRSTMINTLLDDIVQGLPFESIKKRWDAKMHPLQYQRPSAPPKEGNIEQANKVVAKLQSEGALARRFARLDEVAALWKPRAAEPVETKRTGGPFDHLKTSGAKGSAVKEVELPPTKMTWETFRDTVLPNALSVEANVPQGNTSFYGLVTAVNADAPPVLQWDGLEGQPRNPVSWYVWHQGSPAHQWGLSPGWNKVSAICLMPCHWQSDKFTQFGPGVFFVLDGAKDSRDAGGGFFPETLRSEYHGIRSVMEAHSRSSKLAGKEEQSANGLALGSDGSLLVRVKTNGGPASYAISM